MKKTNLFDYTVLMYFVIRATFFNLFLNNLLKISKQDSYISIFIAIILSIIPIIIYYKNKHNTLSLFENNKKIYKHYKIINMLLVLTTILLSSYLLWNLSSFVKQHLLYKTPNLIIMLVFALPILYTILKGYKSLNRGKVIMFFISIIMFIITFVALIPNMKLTNVLPFNYNSDISLGIIFYIIYLILPLYTLNLFPKQEIKNYNIKKITIYIMLFQLIPLLMTLALLSIYGINLSLFLNIPEYHVLKRIGLFSSLNRIDSILYIQAFFDYFVSITFYLYFSYKGIKTTYNIKHPKILISIILILICFLVNKINYNIIHFISIYILPYVLILSFLIIPIITLIKKNYMK